MRVKIGDTWYNPNEVFIMLELTNEDKFLLSHMAPEATKFASCPNTMSYDEMRKLMEVSEDITVKVGKEDNGLQN
jgi:hypothetical protein